MTLDANVQVAKGAYHEQMRLLLNVVHDGAVVDALLERMAEIGWRAVMDEFSDSPAAFDAEETSPLLGDKALSVLRERLRTLSEAEADLDIALGAREEVLRRNDPCRGQVLAVGGREVAAINLERGEWRYLDGDRELVDFGVPTVHEVALPVNTGSARRR